MATMFVPSRNAWVLAAVLVGVSRIGAQTSFYEQGRAAFDTQRYADAASLIAKAEAGNPAASDAQLFEGKALADLGRFAESESVLHRYLHQAPRSADALFELGFVLHRENKPADSLKIYTQAASLSMPKPDDLKIVALDYVLLDDYPDAIHWMEKAVQLDARNVDAWYGLGRCYYTQSRFTDAERAFMRVLELDPQHIKAEENLGLVYDAQNKPVDADRAFKAAADLARGSSHTDEWPYLNYGAFLLQQNRAADAIPRLRQAVAIAPQCADCRGKLGRALIQVGDREQGISELEQAVARSPKDAKLHYQLGLAYRQTGKEDRAKQELTLSAQLYGDKNAGGPWR